MNLQTCPGHERLNDFVEGRLDLPGHEDIETHLDECAACQTVIETLDEGLASQRWANAVPVAVDEGIVNRLAERAKSLAFDPLVPRQWGHYLIRERLGFGGMGQVFKAEHALMKRPVAVKILAHDLFRSESARLRFRREWELAGRVASPHVVAALDAGEADGRPYLVMEYIAGRDLARIVADDGPLPWRRALDVVRQAALGLADAHDKGIVHRDVKPSNLMEADGTVKLLDLGLARACLECDADTAELTGQHAVMGTAAYIAPEQAADTRRADARSDLYSLGCTLFFLLTGRPPFAGSTAMEVVFAHREKPMPSLRATCPDCPPAVDALFRRLTARRPEDRSASARAVAAEIERLLADPAPARQWFGHVALAVTALAPTAAFLIWSFWPPAQGQPPTTTPASSEVAVKETKPEPPPAVVPAKVVGPDMVLLKPGEFWMGSPDTDPAAEASEKPRHLVRITHPFWIGKFEVTQGEFTDLMGGNCSAFSPEGRAKMKLPPVDPRKLPVESVRWLDALEYCNRLSKKHGLKPYYLIDNGKVTLAGGPGFRLPTEAEWEFACRAGTDTRWSFGDDPVKLDEHAWHARNSGGMPHHVGEKKPNKWGLHDMHGNASEWCWDRYDAGYYRRSVASDPSGSGEGETRVYRGGSWNHHASQTRSADRGSLGLGYGPLAMVGFRVARDSE